MEPRYTKADLLRELDAAWTELDEALDHPTEAQLTQIRDAQGWAAKDHLTHMAAWERSVVAYLRGGARHAGLGVDEELYLAGDEDEINAAIRERGGGASLAEARADLRDAHAQLLGLIEPMGDEDLHRASAEYQPEGPGERDERPIIGMIYANSAHHFREHRGWIESLVRRGG